MTKVIGVIPARWASTRFPGKLLADLAGQPVLEHVWQRASQAKMLDEVLIACDDQKVLTAARQFGAKAVLTGTHHQSGTDRIVEAIADKPCDVVVNIQGDEPLIQPDLIDELVNTLLAVKSTNTVVATPITALQTDEAAADPNCVKVVFDQDLQALYFSRAMIPFSRQGDTVERWQHIGLYAYQREFLDQYVTWPVSALEAIECLEQLRILEHDYQIQLLKTDEVAIGIDTPQDLERVAKMLANEVDL